MSDNDEPQGRGETEGAFNGGDQRSYAGRGCAAQPQTCLDGRLAVGSAGHPIMRATILSSQS